MLPYCTKLLDRVTATTKRSIIQFNERAAMEATCGASTVHSRPRTPSGARAAPRYNSERPHDSYQNQS